MQSVLLRRIGLVHDVVVPHVSEGDFTASEELEDEKKGTGGINATATSPVGVLFSGGIDSVFLTAVLHGCLPGHYSIDLINVSFDGPGDGSEEGSARGKEPSPDRLAAIAAYGELQVRRGEVKKDLKDMHGLIVIAHLQHTSPIQCNAVVCRSLGHLNR
jgi:asparagine synthetase B (glutamine-hydrolysing)